MGLKPNKNHLIFGFGVNDSVEPNSKHEYIDGKSVMVWRCKIYVMWVQMLRRCYSLTELKKRPSYAGCYVSEKWKYYSQFKLWVLKQNWEGNQLDKDLLVPGNREYGPDFCVFIPLKINNFLTENKLNKGEYATGVCRKTPEGYPNYVRYCTYVNNPFTGKKFNLGCFKTPSQARIKYLAQKLKFAEMLGEEQEDEAVKLALVNRYRAQIVEFMTNQ